MDYNEHKGMKISEIGIGCYSLAGVYGQKDIGGFKRMLERAKELGVNYFDTSENYGPSEEIVGEVFRDCRDEVIIADKISPIDGEPDLSHERVKEACKKSLERLGTEYIDIYYIHFDDPKTPVEETISALEELKDEGSIKEYGLGHISKDRVERYIEEGDVFSVMMDLSAVSRESRKNLLPLCRENDVGGIAFSITGRGLLTGKFDEEKKFDREDIRSVDPLFKRDKFGSGLRIQKKFKEIGEEYGKTAVQVGINWVLSQPGIICGLTGPSSIEHLEENLDAVGWTLREEDLEEIESFLDKEDRALKEEQRGSIEEILNSPLETSATEAVDELVYAVESSIELNLVSEEEIMPLFSELWGMRKSSDDNSMRKVKEIQERLKDRILE